MSTICKIHNEKRVDLCATMRDLVDRRVVIRNPESKFYNSHEHFFSLVTWDRPPSETIPIICCPFCGGSLREEAQTKDLSDNGGGAL